MPDTRKDIDPDDDVVKTDWSKDLGYVYDRRGDPVRKKVLMNIRVDPVDRERWKRIALEEGITLSTLIRLRLDSGPVSDVQDLVWRREANMVNPAGARVSRERSESYQARSKRLAAEPKPEVVSKFDRRFVPDFKKKK